MTSTAKTNTATMNSKVYIHEFIFITQQNRGRYMHHMTANWSPIAQEQRHQLCYGVWGVLGSTGPWPQTVNMWEQDGFAGLADSFAVETSGSAMQDPALAKWWAAAADLRSGGFDRVMVPHPSTRPIEGLCADGAGAPVYAHELASVQAGSAPDVLQDAVDEAAAGAPDGWRLIGAMRTAMVADDEVLLLWAIDSWRAWAAVEEREAGRHRTLLPRTAEAFERRHRILLVDAPLAPLRTGRQPSRADRTDWTD